MKKDLRLNLLAVTGITCLCLTGCINSKEQVVASVNNPAAEYKL